MTDTTGQYPSMESYIAPTEQQQAYNAAVSASQGGGSTGGSFGGGGFNLGGSSRMQYNDKDYFALQSALNEAAKTQQEALNKVTARTDQTVGQNIDYFKQLAEYGSNILAPYQALAKTSTPLFLDMLGVNGQAAQQAALPQATNIFNQQGINATPMLQSIPGWSFNTAANQSASFMNSMFGGGTTQPTQQVSNQVTQQGYQQQAQSRGLYGQQASDPFASQGQYQLRQSPQLAQTDTSSYDRQVAAINSAKQAEQQKIAQAMALRQQMEQASAAELQALRRSQELDAARPNRNVTTSSDGTGPASLAYREAVQRSNQLSDTYKNYIADNKLQTDSNGNIALTGNYDAQLKQLQESQIRSALPQGSQQSNVAPARRTVQQGPVTSTVPTLQQPQLQNQQNNELIDYNNRFKATQDAVSDVAGNTQGALSQILGNAQQFGNNALGSNLRDAGGQLLNQFNNTSLNGLMAQGIAGANQANQGSSDALAQDTIRSNRFLDLINNEIGTRPDAVKEASAITQSGLDLGNRQVAPMMDRANGLMDRYMPTQGGNFVQDTLKGLIDPATGAVNSWMNSGVVKDVMDATINSGSNAVQNLAASRGMLDSGQTLAELQRVGTNAAGQYIVPYAGQLANNVLTQGANLASTEMQTGVNAAQNMYGLSNQMVGQTINNQTQSANNRLNNYYNLLGKGMDFAQSTAQNRLTNQGQTNQLAGQFANIGAGLANTSGQLGAGMLTADQGQRAGLMNQAIGAGSNAYNQNLGARTGMATTGLNFANNIMGTQAQMAQGLAGQYGAMGNQFLGNLQSNSNTTANTQGVLQQGGLSSMLQGGLQSAGATADIYSQLGGNVAGQNVYGNDIYGNATMAGAGVEASRIQQYNQLQIMADQLERQKKSQKLSGMFNGGGLALSLGAMALGGL